ncbi:hypothetical protein OK349_00990 [Sphingomonas sp. BT-65]|uniref:hypothetical protein n=1 Tax=Sphingomonas sp. BT-65 TaxID=2989821 RepID=UPI002236979E|nr:hypothetical protein [Sphingomonas sp. BT-65]MCW4460268.1 hypothetical protein [Sphingomonas sp. BT-65]
MTDDLGCAFHVRSFGVFSQHLASLHFARRLKHDKNGGFPRLTEIGTPPAIFLACRIGRQPDTRSEGRNDMYKGNNSFRTTLAAITCTLVVSTTCLASVVGPAATATAEVSTRAIA